MIVVIRYFLTWKLLIGINIPKQVDGTCFQGWSQEKDKCYREFTKPVTWFEAVHECEGSRSELVTLDDITEQTFVMQLRTPDIENSWIGYHKNGSIWQWLRRFNTSLNHLDVSNITADDKCAALSKLGRWIPTKCLTPLPYVCEAGLTDCLKSDGWFVYEAQCLFLNFGTSTWPNAKDTCHSLGAELAIIRNAYKNGMTLFQNGMNTLVWIGLVFNSDKAQFNWIDGMLDNTSLIIPVNTSSSVSNLCGAIDVNSAGAREVVYRSISCDVKLRALCAKALVPADLNMSSISPRIPKPTVYDLFTSTQATNRELNKTPVAENSMTQLVYDLLILLAQCFSTSGSDDNHASECLKEIFSTNDVFCHTTTFHHEEIINEDVFPIPFNGEFFKNLVDGMNIFIKDDFAFNLCKNTYAAAFVILEIILDFTFPFSYMNTETSMRVNSAKVELATYRTSDADSMDPFESKITGCLVNYIQGNISDPHNEMVFAVIHNDQPVKVIFEESFSESNTEFYLVSSVMTLTTYGAKSLKTSSVLSFTMLYLNTEYVARADEINITESQLMCAFYLPRERVWSVTGCSVTELSEYSVTCQCNHTTSFGILMKVNIFQTEEEHEIALNVITYIGCSVSLVSVFLALTVFTCIRSLNSERVLVHRNLCLAILCAQIVFLAGGKAVNNMMVCRITAVVLHYCFLAVFSWVLVEGLHLYTQVVQVFGTEKSRSTYYMCFGWGMPLLLVAISSVADWEGYGTKKSCWLSIDRNTIWAFVGPIIAVITVNLVILIMVLKIVVASAKTGSSSSSATEIKAAVKATLFLLPLLGLTWIFGLLVVNRDLIVFEYLFAITNSLQGFFVFLFHCILNSEVRQALQQIRQRRALLNEDFATEAYSSNSSSASQSSLVHAVEGTIRFRLKYTGRLRLHRKPISEHPRDVGNKTGNLGSNLCRKNSSSKHNEITESNPFANNPPKPTEDPSDVTLLYI